MTKYAEECVVVKQVYFLSCRGKMNVAPCVVLETGQVSRDVLADTGWLGDKVVAQREVITVAFSALKQHV